MLPLDAADPNFHSKLAVTVSAAVATIGLLVLVSGAPRRNKGRPAADPDTLSGKPSPRTTSKWGNCEPVLAKKGVASMKPRTVMELFSQCVSKDGEHMAFRQEVGSLLCNDRLPQIMTFDQQTKE